ncbi:iron chelate uptake ABC transporter family permease subunit, partial [Streptomyces sp. SID7982]|nr:iron chelate uptake ABC transporter family permease subunit [Streptomyces sp. SID7982]
PPRVCEAALAEAARAVARVRRRGGRRSLLVGLALALAAFAVFAVSLSVGEMVIPVGDVLATLFGGGEPGSRFVILELRLPRALLAVLVGAGFGMAGGVFQTVLRNPLASPDIIGISSGASAAAVTASMVFAVSGLALSASALAGALVAGTLIYVLAWRKGVVGARLVLVGLGVGCGLNSLVWYLMSRAEVTGAQNALLWLTGSLNGRSWNQVWPQVTALAVLVPLTLVAARTLRALQLGDDTASGLGARAEQSRLALLACGVALAGVSTAA